LEKTGPPASSDNTAVAVDGDATNASAPPSATGELPPSPGALASMVASLATALASDINTGAAADDADAETVLTADDAVADVDSEWVAKDQVDSSVSKEAEDALVAEYEADLSAAAATDAVDAAVAAVDENAEPNVNANVNVTQLLMSPASQIVRDLALL
jgi:hypothetical protein